MPLIKRKQLSFQVAKRHDPTWGLSI